MSTMLELPDGLAASLAERARRAGVSLPEYAIGLLSEPVAAEPARPARLPAGPDDPWSGLRALRAERERDGVPFRKAEEIDAELQDLRSDRGAGT